MATQVQRRKGTTAQHSTFTGAIAELTVDTTKNTVVVHDGVTAGGTPLAKESGSALSPSSLTLSGGTANGVAYLNGSKVLTTGSALTFDGTGLSVTGSTSATLKLNGRSSDNGSSANFYDNTGTTRYGFIYFDASTAQIASANTTPLAFLLNGSEQMRLTSTGLGIGTSSPVAKLQVAGGVYASGGNNFFTDASGGYWASGNNAYAVGWYEQSGSMLFRTATTERMRLDTSGNLGLGVTPSAWDVGTMRGFQIGSGAAFVGDVGLGYRARILANAYFGSGGYKYLNNGPALLHTLDGNTSQYQWNIAPSGTAGNAISFTQAMTLDASGRLQLGTTSAGGDLTVFENASAATKVARFVQANSSAGTLGAVEIVSAVTGGSALDVGQWNIASGSWVQRWYNNVGRGASDSISGTGAPNFLAGIDSSGNLLVGTTSAISGGKVSIQYTGVAGLGFQPTSDSGAYPVAFNNAAGSGVGSISTTSTATSYNTSSDYRLKTLVGEVTGAGDRIDALNPVEFEWNINGQRDRGFFAHQFQTVYPNSVTGSKDAVDAEGKPVYQAMQAGSSEVIADLVVEIQSLRKRLAVLEAA